MTNKVSMNIRLENDPTKAQENDLLMKIYDAFKGSGTYLEMLLSEKMVEWARLRILNDFPPDIFEQAEYWEEEAKLREKQTRRVIDQKDKLFNTQLEKTEELFAKIDAKDELIGDLRTKAQELQTESSERKAVIIEMSKEKEALVARLEELKTPYHTRLEDLEADVERLKNPISENY